MRNHHHHNFISGNKAHKTHKAMIKTHRNEKDRW